MKQYISYSENETKKIASKLARKIKANVIALSGELGAGKTIFVQGFAKALGIKEKIISPTFVLIRQHKIPNTKNTLYHIDLYRLENNIDIKQLGINEIISNPDNLVLIEWAEKLAELPKGTLKITIQKNTTDSRTILIHKS